MLAALPPMWPHQVRGYQLLREAAARQSRVEREPGRGYGILLQAPTGAGKTRLGLEVGTNAIEKGGRVLWLAHREELVDQPAERMRALGWTDIAVIKAGRTEGDPEAGLIIASVQTLAARLKREEALPTATVVVLDECRHFASGAATWFALAEHYAHAVRVGFDATPSRADGSPLGDLFDELVSVASIGELTDAGFLVPARLIAAEEATKTLCAEPVAFYEQHQKGRSCLVFCPSVAYAREQTAAFIAAGYTTTCVVGSTSKDERRASIDAFRAGEITILVGVDVFVDGFDAPICSALIIARGCGHDSTWLQMIGRGLRCYEGKTDCIVGDLRGHVHKHGLPADERTWHLTGKSCRKGEALPPCVQCVECHAWNRGGACPHCGAELPAPKPPKVTKREMREIEREEKYANQVREGDRWEFYLECAAMVINKGWKRGSLWVRYNEKYHCAPPYRLQDAQAELLRRAEATRVSEPERKSA